MWGQHWIYMKLIFSVDPFSWLLQFAVKCCNLYKKHVHLLWTDSTDLSENNYNFPPDLCYPVLALTTELLSFLDDFLRQRCFFLPFLSQGCYSKVSTSLCCHCWALLWWQQHTSQDEFAGPPGCLKTFSLQLNLKLENLHDTENGSFRRQNLNLTSSYVERELNALWWNLK